MNYHRRIQRAEVRDFDLIMIGGRDIAVDPGVVDLVHNNDFLFARRPFKGARAVIFKLDQEYTDFVNRRLDCGFGVSLCVPACQRILGVGRRTKKFTLYFKEIKE